MEKRRNCSFIYIFLTSGVKLHINLLNVVVQFIVFLTLSTLICRSTDISKCFSESLGIRDNESRLYFKISNIYATSINFLHRKKNRPAQVRKRPQPLNSQSVNIFTVIGLLRMVVAFAVPIMHKDCCLLLHFIWWSHKINNIIKHQKGCLWKQRTHYRLENGSLGFNETLHKQ